MPRTVNLSVFGLPYRSVRKFIDPVDEDFLSENQTEETELKTQKEGE